MPEHGRRSPQADWRRVKTPSDSRWISLTVIVVPSGMGFLPSQLTIAQWSTPSTEGLSPPIGAFAILIDGFCCLVCVLSGSVGSGAGAPVDSVTFGSGAGSP